MISRKKACALVLLTLLNVGESRAVSGIDFTDCGSKYHINRLEISSCNEIPCSVIKGHLITISIQMTPKSSSTELSDLLKFDAYWVVGGTQYNAMIIPEYCGRGDCLLIQNNQLIFSAYFYVSEIMPTFTTGALIWKNLDYSTDEILTCSRIPIYLH